MKRKIVLLTSSILIFTFCIFSFAYFTTRRNVSLEYTMYYIDHELNYYLEDNGFKNYYSVGTTCDYKSSGNYRNQGSGWAKVNKNSTKTNARISNVYFYVNECEKNLTFKINVEKRERTMVDIYINDVKTEYTFDIVDGYKHSCSLNNSLFKKNAVNKISMHNSSDTCFYVRQVALL